MMMAALANQPPGRQPESYAGVDLYADVGVGGGGDQVQGGGMGMQAAPMAQPQQQTLGLGGVGGMMGAGVGGGGAPDLTANVQQIMVGGSCMSCWVAGYQDTNHCQAAQQPLLIMSHPTSQPVMPHA
jgi:hypothetical protein